MVCSTRAAGGNCIMTSPSKSSLNCNTHLPSLIETKRAPQVEAPFNHPKPSFNGEAGGCFFAPFSGGRVSEPTPSRLGIQEKHRGIASLVVSNHCYSVAFYCRALRSVLRKRHSPQNPHAGESDNNCTQSPELFGCYVHALSYPDAQSTRHHVTQKHPLASIAKRENSCTKI